MNMRIRDAFGIYNIIETIMRKSERPLTCVELFDDADVKRFADSPSRVSDYLGHMYRRGLLGREPAPKGVNSQARWGYFWKNRAEVVVPTAVKAVVTTEEAPASAALHKVLSKPSIDISEHGGTVIIELPQLTITIRSKT